MVVGVVVVVIIVVVMSKVTVRNDVCFLVRYGSYANFIIYG